MAKVGNVYKIIKLLMKVLFVALVLFVYGFLIFRMCSLDSLPNTLDDLVITEGMKNAYAKSGGDDFIYQRKNLFNTDEKTYGLFAVPSYVIVKGADEIQVVFRYNVSTLEKVAEELELSSVPDRNTEGLFDLTLSLKHSVGEITDAVEGQETIDYDQPENHYMTLINPDRVEHFTEGKHNYVRCIFKSVGFDESNTLGVFLNVYYRDNVNYEELPLGTVRLYHYTTVNKPYPLTKNDKEALTEE